MSGGGQDPPPASSGGVSRVLFVLHRGWACPHAVPLLPEGVLNQPVFGPDRKLDSITPGDAEDIRRWMLSEARAQRRAKADRPGLVLFFRKLGKFLLAK